jgi:hypothetical protein
MSKAWSSRSASSRRSSSVMLVSATPSREAMISLSIVAYARTDRPTFWNSFKSE